MRLRPGLVWMLSVPFLALVVGWPAPATARAAGVLQLQASPAKATSDTPAITVRVANTGDAAIQEITLGAAPPAGVTAEIEPPPVRSLAAGSSILVPLTTTGSPTSRPATLVITATGTTGAATLTATATIDLVATEAAAALTLTGNNRLTESSPADLIAVVDNTADVAAEVSIRAVAGRHLVRLAKVDGDVTAATPGDPLVLTVGARQSAVVLAQVEAQRPLRRGSTALVLTATIRAPATAAPVDISAARSLDVVLAADVLPGLLGVGSILLIPGLLGLWAALSVVVRDRRRAGLTVPDASQQIWDNKTWIAVAGVISLAAAAAYALAGFADLLDTYTLSDVVILTLLTMLLAFALSSAAIRWHRRTTKPITSASSPLDVLRAAQRADDNGPREVYRTADGKLGLLVHRDLGTVVLSPRIRYSEMDEINTDKSLGAAIRLICNAGKPEQHIAFGWEAGFVEGPGACPDARLVTAPKVPLLAYADQLANADAAP